MSGSGRISRFRHRADGKATPDDLTTMWAVLGRWRAQVETFKARLNPLTIEPPNHVQGIIAATDS